MKDRRGGRSDPRGRGNTMSRRTQGDEGYKGEEGYKGDGTLDSRIKWVEGYNG